jgi:hypothetical protein
MSGNATYDAFACQIIASHFSLTMPNAPAPSHSEHSTFLCLARVLHFGFVCLAWGSVSSSYGASCVLDGTD